MKTVKRKAWELSSILEIDELSAPPRASPTGLAEMLVCEGKVLLKRSLAASGKRPKQVSARALAGVHQHNELDRCTRIVEAIRRGVR